MCYGPCTDIHDIRCEVCNRTTIHWCPKCSEHCRLFRKSISIKTSCPDRQILVDELEKLNIPILNLNNLVWFSKTKRTKRMAIRANHFLSNLLNMLESDNLIITYGDLDLNEVYRISELFDCDTTYLTDQSGVLKQFERRIRMRDIQKEKYNNPPLTLPYLNSCRKSLTVACRSNFLFYFIFASNADYLGP